MGQTEVDAIEDGALLRLQEENSLLRERLDSAERYTAQTLARATRLSQVISVLGGDADFDTVVERAAVEMAELFSADIAVLMLGSDAEIEVEGQCGVRPVDVPDGTFVLRGVERLTHLEPVVVGPADSVSLPPWLGAYKARHVAWARLLVGDESLGMMLLVRRAPEPFERSDVKELRAIAYRIALALENSLLNRRTARRLEQLGQLQENTTKLAGLLELEPVGRCVAEMLVEELPELMASVVLIERQGKLTPVGRFGCDEDVDDVPTWTRFPLETPGRPIGTVAVANPPAPATEDHEMLLHLLGIAALALNKALLYERSREQARRDSLTGLLGHRAFQEVLATLSRGARRFSVALIDIDDFKQVNDLYGHRQGDDALRLVADALRDAVRGDDNIYRIGGEEFCVVLPGLGSDDAVDVAERLRAKVAEFVSSPPVTVSIGVASYPTHALRRDDLLERADDALYASKRSGKNRTSVAGDDRRADGSPEPELTAQLMHVQTLIHEREPSTVPHSAEVATLAVELARALGVEDGRLADLRTAARLHDIGKVAVPVEILNKPAALDEDEYLIVQTHPVVGSELLSAWGHTGPARFVLEHHENVDGTGYPAGLTGDRVALESRIIRVADAFAAMTLERPYRGAMTRAAALAELVRYSGTQFDASVVRALVKLEGASG